MELWFKIYYCKTVYGGQARDTFITKIMASKMRLYHITCYHFIILEIIQHVVCWSVLRRAYRFRRGGWFNEVL